MKNNTYLAALALLFMATTANATIMINTNQAASGSIGIVLAVDGTGNPVFGEADGTSVRFDAAESLIATGGQSRFEAADGLFTDTLITLPGFNFDRLVFNLFDPVADGTVNITATDTFGNVFVAELGLSQNGQNFYNVESDDLQQIASVSLSTSVGVGSLRQVRVGGIEESLAPIPEPGTYALLASGLGVCAWFKRRSKLS